MRYVKVVAKPPGAAWRLIVSVLLFAGCCVWNYVSREVVRQAAYAAALKQVDGDPAAYEILRASSIFDLAFFGTIATICIVGLLWLSYLLKHIAWEELQKTPEESVPETSSGPSGQ